MLHAAQIYQSTSQFPIRPHFSTWNEVMATSFCGDDLHQQGNWSEMNGVGWGGCWKKSWYRHRRLEIRAKVHFLAEDQQPYSIFLHPIEHLWQTWKSLFRVLLNESVWVRLNCYADKICKMLKAGSYYPQKLAAIVAGKRLRWTYSFFSYGLKG